MIDFTDTDIGRKDRRRGEDLWRDQMIDDRRARHAANNRPKRVLPRRKRTLAEKIANLYRRLVGRPTR